MSSNRLPGKSLMNLTETIKVVDSVYQRCSQSILNGNIIFCISDSAKDDPLNEYLLQKNYKTFRGSEDNLVKRFHDACKTNSLSSFIRVTGDNPLVDPEIIDYFALLSPSKDFIDGFSSKNLPNGTIVSRISFKLLKYLLEKEKNQEHLEHVVTSDLINSKLIPDIKKEWINPKVRYCIDYKEDYIFLKKLFKIQNILEYSTEQLISLYKNIEPENINIALKGY